MKHQPSLFDNPPPPDANDPYQARREPPQVQARRDGLRVAEPFQHDLRAGIIAALHAAPNGLTRAELLAYANDKRASNPAGEQSLCGPLKQLENDNAIWIHPERRMGTRGVKVTVYMHNRFRDAANIEPK